MIEANGLKKKAITHAILAIGSIVAYYCVELVPLNVVEENTVFIRKLCTSLFFIFLILLAEKLIEMMIIKRTDDKGNQYNLIRILHLFVLIAVVIVGISFLFQNLYAAAASFGLASLVLGFALQAPISSFIGWLYIVYRKPYKVGDRIQVNGHRGDIVEITYLDTIMNECSGDYLGNDRNSGRIIHFPNSTILKEKVVNYSGNDVPFIWNEIRLQIAYTSDVDFVEENLQMAANEDFIERYPHLKQEEKHAAAVYFFNNRFAWLEAVVQYPVEPYDTTGRRNRILKKVLPLFNGEPEKVQFPQGTGR